MFALTCNGKLLEVHGLKKVDPATVSVDFPRKSDGAFPGVGPVSERAFGEWLSALVVSAFVAVMVRLESTSEPALLGRTDREIAKAR